MLLIAVAISYRQVCLAYPTGGGSYSVSKRNFGRQDVGDFDTDGVCVSLIQKRSGLSQSTVSSYLALLTRAGVVKAKRVGQWTYYRRDEAAIRRFLDDLTATLK